MTHCPLFVELCAGTAALSLKLHAGQHARPPVSRMGAKTGYAHAILRALGLRQGQGQADGTRYLWCEPDQGVRLMLHAYTDRELAQEAARIIRSWKDEEPRALWERLRAEGPARCPPVDAREVARWCWVQGHEDMHGRDVKPQYQPGSASRETWKPPPRDWLATRLGTTPALPATITDDARKVDPREVARWCWVRRRSAHGKGDGYHAGNETHKIAPESPAETIEAATGLPATITDDARNIRPHQLPAGTVVYADVPYQNTTQYAHLFPREEWLPVVRAWAAAGATVCVSEAEPIPDLVAEGWHAVEITGTRRGQKRTFSAQQAEWLTLSREPRWRPSEQRSLFGAP
jgi:hypothetical protein